MKKIFALVLLSLVLFRFSIAAQDFRIVRDGIEYAEVLRGTKEAPIHINLLKLDLTKVRLDVAHAMVSAIGVEKTSSMATRYGAIAAINAGFFRLDKSIFAGDSTGVLMIDGKLLSESSNDRTALFINNESSQTRIDFDHLDIRPIIYFNKNFWFDIDVNRERKDDDCVLYTPEFNRTTLTNNDGIEIIVRKNKITEIINGKGSNSIPSDGFVISATGTLRERVQKIAKISGKAVVLSASSTKIKEPYEDIVGGVPQLIKNGKIEITWEEEKQTKEFVETRHPRTAVAKLKDGKFLMITVDGRQEGWSVGMDLNELAAFLVELGATDAMNLDGGGSTTMFLDGKVVNRPSDKEGERSVSDAILVFPRK